MKTIKNYALLFLAIFFMSCSGGGDKFVGEWTPVEGRRMTDTIAISKEGNVYHFIDEDGEKNGSFLYDKERDALSMDQGNGIIDIEYDRKKKTITIVQRGGERLAELQKVK